MTFVLLASAVGRECRELCGLVIVALGRSRHGRDAAQPGEGGVV
jgi:hypothetical protein